MPAAILTLCKVWGSLLLRLPVQPNRNAAVTKQPTHSWLRSIAPSCACSTKTKNDGTEKITFRLEAVNPQGRTLH